MPGPDRGLTILSRLFSKICLACGSRSGPGDLCRSCWEDPVWCHPGSRVVRENREIRFVYSDTGPVARLFRLAKNRGNRKAMEILLDRGHLSRLLPGGARILLPVPPSKKRLIGRDLSFPDSLAFRLHRIGGIPLSFSGIVRTAETPQKNRSRPERRETLFSPHFRLETKGLSRCPREGIVLVDDLMVTGFTLRSIDRLLFREGLSVLAHIALLGRGEGKEVCGRPFFPVR